MSSTTIEETITPQTAVSYLKANTDNYRKLRKSVVKRYAADMKAGRWQLNGQPIVFGVNGMLKDGQHRLAAIVTAGVPVKMLVTRGIDDSVSVYDVGLIRTANDISSASGLNTNPSILAAVNLLLNISKSNVSKTEVVQFAKEHEEDLNRAYKCACAGGKGNKFNRKSYCILSAYLALKASAIPYYEIEVFFRVLSTANTVGSDGYEPSSALVARRMLDERKGASNQKVQKEHLEILIQALTDFHNGKTRSINYKIQQPFKYEALLQKVTGKNGGLNGGN